ncbi:MAG: helix-turn-helix domain-containing protein [Terriglobales bacterium]
MITIDDYVIDVLMRDLVGHDRRVVSFLVYLWFAAEQEKVQGKDQPKGNIVETSYRQIAEAIGVSKSSAQAAVAWLIKRKLLVSTKKTVTATPRYKVLTPWRDHESRTRGHS